MLLSSRRLLFHGLDNNDVNDDGNYYDEDNDDNDDACAAVGDDDDDDDDEPSSTDRVGWPVVPDKAPAHPQGANHSFPHRLGRQGNQPRLQQDKRSVKPSSIFIDFSFHIFIELQYEIDKQLFILIEFAFKFCFQMLPLGS